METCIKLAYYTYCSFISPFYDGCLSTKQKIFATIKTIHLVKDCYSEYRSTTRADKKNVTSTTMYNADSRDIYGEKFCVST